VERLTGPPVVVQPEEGCPRPPPVPMRVCTKNALNSLKTPFAKVPYPQTVKSRSVCRARGPRRSPEETRRPLVKSFFDSPRLTRATLR
jgi:hypothetical protein